MSLEIEPFEPIEFYELPHMYHGITLNEQDIDLLNIVGATTPEELQRVSRTLTNIPTNLTNVTEENLEEIKRQLFYEYQRVLIPKNEYFKDKSIKLNAKINYLFNSGYLTEEEINIVKEVIPKAANHNEIVRKLQERLGKEKTRQILLIIRDTVPIEKSGIKNTSYEAYENLYGQLHRFNSVTLDDQFKYGSIVLQDGSMVFHHFEKGLQFAEAHNMQVRGNSLISYMGCPDYVYDAEPSKEIHDIAYRELDNYIKGIFTLLSRPEYKDRVRSIDIFNELLTRKGPNYTFRGDASQDVPPEKLDDYKSGWYKHLSLEEIFKLIADNKHLLEGNVDFMYNEVFLEDPKKMVEFHKMMAKIKQFEQTHNTKIIDTLGIQLHTNNHLTKEQLTNMLIEMAKYGYPIEITEFDMTMSNEDIKDLTEQEIEIKRQRKINEILTTIYSLREECKIKGFTIWSLTDTHNFEVSLANEFRVPNGEESITSLHAGYFTREMTPRSEEVKKAFNREDEESLTLEEEGPRLTYKPKRPNPYNNDGFASILIIAIVVGGFLGILLAFAILNIK